MTNTLYHLNFMDMEGILIPLGFFASIVLVVYIFYTNRNRERIALIDKGIGADIFNQIPAYSMLSFKIGFFLVGLGIGSLIGNIVAVKTMLEDGVAYFSMILLFGGLSLILFHLLEKKFIRHYKKVD